MKPTPAKTITTHTAALEQLEGVLRQIFSEHEQLLALAADHRRAISEADAGSLRSCLLRQGEVAARITTLERQRQHLVASLIAGSPANPAAHAMPRPTMSTLAALAPEPIRSRLLAVAAALRDLLNRLHREHKALRLAAETLSSHMEGVMRQVCRTLSHAGTYARSGAIDSSVQVVTSLDLKT